jgi:urease accessory protein
MLLDNLPTQFGRAPTRARVGGDLRQWLEPRSLYRAQPTASPRSATRDEDLARARGRLRIAFHSPAPGVTRLSELAQQSPCRALFPDEDGESLAIIANTAGGVCGDDRMQVRIEMRAGARASVAGQAAEKIYRAIGSPARLSTQLVLEEEARLHWAPQATILFDAARLERRTEIRVVPGARLLAAETLVFGRRAMGEAITFLDLRDDWRIHRGNTLVWADALRLRGSPPEALASPAGLAGAEALSTIVYAGEGADVARDVARQSASACEVAFGATVVNDLMVARVLGSSARVRETLVRVLPALRGSALGFEARLPRVWSC